MTTTNKDTLELLVKVLVLPVPLVLLVLLVMDLLDEVFLALVTDMKHLEWVLATAKVNLV
jgi:hypothetical protein